MIVYRNFVQYSPEYWEKRRGKPTASEFGRILTPAACERWTCVAPGGETCGTNHTSFEAAAKCAGAKNKKRADGLFAVEKCPAELAAGHRSYVNQLVAETLHFDPNFFTERRPMSRAIEEGVRREPESRNWYAMHVNEEVEQVGFCTTDDGLLGSSPDGLVGEDGVLELKNPDLETHVGYLLDGVLPGDYVPQCHGHLIVTGRKWVDFVSYHPAATNQFKVRVTANEYTDQLRAAAGKFLTVYADAKARVLAMA